MTKAPFAPDQIKLVYNGNTMETTHTLSQYTNIDGDTLHEIRCHGAFFCIASMFRSFLAYFFPFHPFIKRF